jgi:CCR4-NOT transcription complex subunit 3
LLLSRLAYSKEGLAAAAARGDEDKEKTVQREYLNKALSTLKEQTEQLDYEIEAAGNRKRAKDTKRLGQLRDFITRHKFHVRALEKTLRLLENDSITPEQVEAMQDDLDYYLESNQDPDFYYDDEQIYEPVGLTTEGLLLFAVVVVRARVCVRDCGLAIYC